MHFVLEVRHEGHKWVPRGENDQVGGAKQDHHTNDLRKIAETLCESNLNPAGVGSCRGLAGRQIARNSSQYRLA